MPLEMTRGRHAARAWAAAAGGERAPKGARACFSDGWVGLGRVQLVR
jgi:hypothetical protein